MAILRDVPANDLIEAIANELKRIRDISPPEWAVFVKTGMHKERPPTRPDWWHVRAAAVLKSVERLGPVGVSKLRTKYGGKKNRGHKPERFYRGSGNIIRKALQQLEKAGLIKKADKGVHKGRIVTPAGKKIIANAMKEARKSYSKREASMHEKKAEKPAEEKMKPEQKQAPKKPQPKEEKTAAPQETAVKNE